MPTIKTKSIAYDHLRCLEDFPELTSNDFFLQLRAREFQRLDDLGHTYLDFTGGGQYAESQLDYHMKFLRNNVLGNPHSTNPTSQLATQKSEEAREKVLEYFNAKDDYICIFTSNASAALKIVGECYPFCKDGQLLLFFDNHNSVNGIREYCSSKEGSYTYCPMYLDSLRVNEHVLAEELAKSQDVKDKLFAFPAQSNVSGVKHDLRWVPKAQAQGWDVLLDAAAYVPTNPLDLQKVQPEFVSVSFYKMFGYPTGLGCLLMKKSVFHKLKKPWFAGGTVSFVSVNTPGHYLQGNHERFENGTISYMEIPAITTGLEFLEEVGVHRIQSQVKALTALLLEEMNALHYSNGQKLVNVLGPDTIFSRGGTIIFNLFTREGEVIDFAKVEAEANAKNISLRTGCFCNPGLDEILNCISAEESLKYYTIPEDEFTFHQAVHHLGRMRGAIRISVGFITSLKDVNTFIQFLQHYLGNTRPTPIH